MRSFGVRSAAVLLAATLAAPIGWSQQSLQIRVLAGEGGINNINQRVVVEPIVEVVDAEGRPVPKATVRFRAPASGPSVTFFGASNTAELTTDDSGRAQATGMLPNTEAGAFVIDVEAEHEGQSAAAEIAQTNSYPVSGWESEKKKRMGWKIMTLVVVGAAAGIAIAALSGDGDTTNPTSVGVGGVSVGAPR